MVEIQTYFDSNSSYSNIGFFFSAQRRARQRQQQAKAMDPAGNESPTRPTQYDFPRETDGDEEAGVSSPTRNMQDENGSQSTWDGSEQNSEALNSVVSGSSVWTDNSSNPTDRSSRRALILQMAKARMKSNKGRDSSTIKEEKSGMEESQDESDVQNPTDDNNEMRLQGSAESGTTDLDFAADLD